MGVSVCLCGGVYIQLKRVCLITYEHTNSSYCMCMCMLLNVLSTNCMQLQLLKGVVVDLLQHILTAVPGLRYTVAMIMQHPWMQN